MGTLSDSRLHQSHDFIDKQAETTHRQQQSEKKTIRKKQQSGEKAPRGRGLLT
jgi:hypothetical protein